MEALLLAMFPATAPQTLLSLWPSIGVLAGFGVAVFVAGFVIVNRRSTLPAV
jgi:hypothetical protein